MEKIENVCNPKVGMVYLVKCVLRKEDRKWTPVFGELHHDKELYLQEMHYHKDWRFEPIWHVLAQEDVFRKAYPTGLGMVRNSHLFTPVTEKEILRVDYRPLLYRRHFRKMIDGFPMLPELYRDVVMKDMVCPHKKANLTSCQVVNNVVTCPLHGLKWNIITGQLVK